MWQDEVGSGVATTDLAAAGTVARYLFQEEHAQLCKFLVSTMCLYEEPAHLLGSSNRLVRDNVLVHSAETRTGGHFVYYGGISM